MRLPPYHEKEVGADFSPIAQRIVIDAMRVVAQGLIAADLSENNSLTAQERDRLRKPASFISDVSKIAGKLVSEFLRKKVGYKSLFRSARREVAVIAEIALGRAINHYRRADSIEPMDYYSKKYEALFRLLELPGRSLLFVDCNLYDFMRPAEHRAPLIPTRQAARARQLKGEQDANAIARRAQSSPSVK
jgi:hypothetical protein